LSNIKKAVGIFAVKGGVGKTVLSLSVAKALSRNLKVGLIDTDIDNSNFAQFTGIEGGVEVDKSEKKFKLYNWDGVQVFSMSILVGRDRSVSMTGDRYVQMISDIVEFGDWNCDIMIIDLPSGSSDIWKGVLKIFGGIYGGSVIITQPNMTDSLIKGIKLHKYFDLPILGVVENMSFFECEHGGKYRIFGDSQVEDICREYGVEYLGDVPIIHPLKIPVEGEVVDKICGKIVEAPILKTSFLERLMEAAFDKIKEEFERVMVPLILSIQKELDFRPLAVEAGFVEQRPFIITITDELGERRITSIPLKIKDGKLYVIKDASKVDFEIALSLKTFAKVVLGEVDPWDAWLNGDIRTYGVGFTQRSYLVLKEIFTKKDVMQEFINKYGPILKRWA
jgi:Mrp family chromosome partitioning ATPase